MPILRFIGGTEVNSHVVKVNVEINDLNALAQAAQDCGLEFVEGQQTFRWYGRHVGDYALPEGFTARDMGKCEHALRVPGDHRAYEIGIARNPVAAGFTLLFDFWAGGHGLMKKVHDTNGAEGNADLLVGRYVLNVARNAAFAQGWNVIDHGNMITVEHPNGGTLDVRADGSVEANGFTGRACHDASQVLVQRLGTESDFQPKPEYFDGPPQGIDHWQG